MKKLADWQNEDTFVITRVTLVDPDKKQMFPGHVVVKAGKIDSVEKGEPGADGMPVFDGEGLHLSPGFIDMHVHLREPGFEHKEDITSGTLAAAAGGFTSVACMPNTEPAIDDKSVVDFIKRKARIAGYAKVYPVAAVTMERKGEKLSEFNRLVSAGAVAFSDDGSPIATAQLVRRALEYANHVGVPVIEHCEDPSMAMQGSMNEGFTSTKLGLRGIPSYSEEVCLSRDLLVLNSVRSRLHIAHVSTKGSIELLREAKRRGLPVTAETAPHYFSLDETLVETFNTSFKVNPPLRSVEDKDAIIAGLKDGTLDCIATDHAPHAEEEKEVEFEYAPPGMVGLETALGVIITHLVKPGHLALPEALACITSRPADILRIEGGYLQAGAPADLTLFDPGAEWTVSEGELRSKSKNCPFLGQALSGKVKYTLVDGKVINTGRVEV